MDKKTELFVISHSHRDREWYETFQGFRKRLVYMIDELLDLMENNDDCKYFHFDGQTVVLEDYLLIRPENYERLKALIIQGRIIIGPWYVMPDEFLVSGESLIRNLQTGFQISRSFEAEPMKSGYVIDIFGHNSQFPQILRGFNIDSAVLFRGIADYEKDAFIWKGADGSNVFCIKLDRERSYSNFYFAVRWPFEGRGYDRDELVLRMKKLVEYSRTMSVSNNILMMDGCDHSEYEPQLPWILKTLNESIDDINIHQDTLENFIRTQQNASQNLDEISGELYNVGKRGVNNQVLKNVLSSMVHLKQLNSYCETLLLRWAEPFDLFAEAFNKRNNEGFFKEAWKTLLLNHPHDSICGCSISEVHRDNEYRFNQVQDIGHGILDDALNDIASGINTSTLGEGQFLVLFNSGQNDFCGITKARLEFNAASSGNFKLYDQTGNVVPYQILKSEKGIVKKVQKYGELIDFCHKDYYEIAFNAVIPAIGYSTYRYREENIINYPSREYTYKVFNPPVRYPGSMHTEPFKIENGILEVTFKNGSLNVVNKATNKEYKNLLVFEDGGDGGDGWNYRKPLHDSVYTTHGMPFEFSVESDGPFLTQWKVVNYLELPYELTPALTERSEQKETLKITTFITLLKNSSRIEFKTLINNNITEHRLRVLFPSFLNTEVFLSQTPFYMQPRSIKKADTNDCQETETGVFPNQGLIILEDEKDCMAVLNKGLYEVEVSEDKSKSVALTLFRSFRHEVGKNIGKLSFMKREMQFDYAVDFLSSGMDLNTILAKKEDWKSGIKEVCTSSHETDTPLTASAIEVKGAVLSSYKKGKDGMYILRIYNCADKNTTCIFTLNQKPKSAYFLNLNDEVIDVYRQEGKNGNLNIDAGKIITLGFYL